MKKIALVLCALVLCLGMVACNTGNGNGNHEAGNLEGTLEEILEGIYENADLSESFREYIETGLYTTEINTDNIIYYLGTDRLEFEAAIASEPVMMPSAYSLCLVRARDGADIEKMKTAIRENVDPTKWICVGVDPQNVIVDNIGNVIFLLMSDNETQSLYDAFLALEG